jgi:hypothetical protein
VSVTSSWAHAGVSEALSLAVTASSAGPATVIVVAVVDPWLELRLASVSGVGGAAGLAMTAAEEAMRTLAYLHTAAAVAPAVRPLVLLLQRADHPSEVSPCLPATTAPHSPLHVRRITG